MTRSFLRLSAIQGIECEKNMADLAPKSGLVSAEPVESEAG